MAKYIEMESNVKVSFEAELNSRGASETKKEPADQKHEEQE